MKIDWITNHQTSHGKLRALRASGLTLVALGKLVRSGVTEEELLKRYPQLNADLFKLVKDNLDT